MGYCVCVCARLSLPFLHPSVCQLHGFTALHMYMKIGVGGFGRLLRKHFSQKHHTPGPQSHRNPKIKVFTPVTVVSPMCCQMIRGKL